MIKKNEIKINEIRQNEMEWKNNDSFIIKKTKLNKMN